VVELVVVAPWTATVRDRTLIVTFSEPYRVVSWAPLGGGLMEARTILNHQVNIHETSMLAPEVFMHNLAQWLGVELPVVGLMTGVLMERLVRNVAQQGDLTVECFATVGLSNALAAGDPATYEEKLGTINLIVAINQPLTIPAMMEAVQIVTEAKVAALFAAQIRSTVSPAFATGTGTDCVAIACPISNSAYRYCGKHTKLGELIGRVTTNAVSEGIRKAVTR
jgi:adenosylcobinamide hydrolase